jgi:leucyl-tRNA synthetase
MLAPFAPFTSEEAWSKLGGEGLISTSSWPEVQESLIDDRSEMLEELAATLLDDVAKVRRVTKMVIKRVSIYVAADWKWEAYSVIINQLRNKKSSIKDAISALQKGGRSGKKGEVAEFVAKSFGELRQLGLDSVSRIPDVGRDSELKFLLECVPFFEKESACKVAVYSEDDPEVHDPKGRAAMAKPLRPAFFLE